MTNALFASDYCHPRAVDSFPESTATMLIGDEMHNLRAPSFLNHAPTGFQHRLGLSATPVRQYDTDGTDRLFEFFGPQVFEFTLGDAIEAGCLVPYEYQLHEVHLDSDEMDRYVELTEEDPQAGLQGLRRRA